MNTGTYYLYEYKQNQRIRTVGFLKLMRTQMHTQLQLHARIHPLSQHNTLKLYPFHVEGSSIIPGDAVEVHPSSGTIYCCLSSLDHPFLTASALSQMDGFFLVLSEQMIFAALNPDIAFDTRNIIDPARSYSTPKAENQMEAETPEAETTETEPPAAKAVEIEATATEAVETETSAAETSETEKISSVRKLHRCDLSGLPRKQWYLANNSFLLHGCHNYGHLILIKEEGRYWLGVPGIYDPKEARAAEMFGFPKFTDSYNDQIPRTEEEDNPYGSFGYWCRSVFPEETSPLHF